MINVNSPEALGKEIIDLARSQLLVNFRYLDRSLVLLNIKESKDVSFISDGLTLYYDPWFILNIYKDDENVINRNYLHLILHFLLKHYLVNNKINKQLWDLACDINVEMIINDLDRDFLKSKRYYKQQSLIHKIKELNILDKPLNAENIYSLLENKYNDEEIEEMRIDVFGDSHGFWYEDEKSRYSKDIDVRAIWEEASKRMEVELDLIENNKDLLLARELRKINKVKKDYDEFLKKFIDRKEILKVSLDEYDNNYYSYGLKLYGNMPIIEPLEYKEEDKIRELIIVLDTSGSIKKELCEKFINHTYKILSNSKRIEDEFNIHIIMCDDKIEEDKVIHNKKEMEEYIKNIKIKGLGETDFRPVFEYVDKLKMKGEFRHLKGLIYFTDGDGIYPKIMPEYDVAFIIHEDENINIHVPSWIIRFDLDEKDLDNGRI